MNHDSLLSCTIIQMHYSSKQVKLIINVSLTRQSNTTKYLVLLALMCSYVRGNILSSKVQIIITPDI